MKTISKIKTEYESKNPYRGYYYRSVRHEITHERFVVPWQMDEKESTDIQTHK
jgi:hypothetical protein